MIARILVRLRAFLDRKSAPLPTDGIDGALTTEEHAALMKALNPAYRVYVRGESGRMVDVGLGEEAGRSVAAH